MQHKKEIKTIYWQRSVEEVSLAGRMSDAKKRYAKAVVKIISNMPPEHHQAAVFYAKDVGYFVSSELLRHGSSSVDEIPKRKK
jgi:hypothetical protein